MSSQPKKMSAWKRVVIVPLAAAVLCVLLPLAFVFVMAAAAYTALTGKWWEPERWWGERPADVEEE